MADQITVIDVNQWAASNYEKHILTEATAQAFLDHDHKAISQRLPAFCKKIDPEAIPAKGHVFMVPGDNGKLKIHRANYDSSD